MSDIAIKVDHVSKTFRIPHEKITSLRSAAVGLFSRKGGYEEFKALDDVSFEVKKGEFFGIIGRNGSGKSTLLKILAGIYQPDAGKIKINGMISPFLELGIGFNPELSGRDNVYLNATVLGMTKKQIDAKFDDIVKFSELERFIDQKLKNYSSGMQVRLAFSVAIHANRDILLMDEVLAVGDSNFQSKCLEEFNKYREQGKTVVLVSHDIGTIKHYCDRALLLRNGKMVRIGKASEVVDEYINGNILDESDRLSEGECGAIKKGDNDKMVEITKVEFLDGDGATRNVFESGSDVIARVYFRKNKDVSVLNFGVGLYNSAQEYIFGINTIMDQIDTKKYLEQGFYEICYNKLSLNTGAYYILTGIGGYNFVNPFDLLPRSQSFKIISRKTYEGIIGVDYSWK